MESEDDIDLLIPDLPSPTSGRTARLELGDGTYADENPMPGPGGGIRMGIVSVEAVSTCSNAPTGGPWNRVVGDWWLRLDVYFLPIWFGVIPLVQDRSFDEQFGDRRERMGCVIRV